MEILLKEYILPSQKSSNIEFLTQSKLQINMKSSHSEIIILV